MRATQNAVFSFTWLILLFLVIPAVPLVNRPIPPQTGVFELIVDGGFESGDICFGGNVGSRLANISSVRAASGLNSLLLGGPEFSGALRGSYSMVYPVSIPATAKSAVLTFDYFGFARRRAPDDFQAAVIGMPTLNGVLEDVFRGRDNSRRWRSATLDLMPFRGRVVTVNFVVIQTARRGKTGMYVDNVSVRVEDDSPPSYSFSVDVAPNPVPRREDDRGFSWGFYIYVTNAGTEEAVLERVVIELLNDNQQPITSFSPDVVLNFARCDTQLVTMIPKGTVFTGYEARFPNNLSQGFARITATGLIGGRRAMGTILVRLLGQ